MHCGYQGFECTADTGKQSEVQQGRDPLTKATFFLLLLLFLISLLPFFLIFCSFFLFFLFKILFSFTRSLGCLGTHKSDRHYQRHSDCPSYLSYSKDGFCYERKNVHVQKSYSWSPLFRLYQNRACGMGSAEQVYIGFPYMSICHGKMTTILLVNLDKFTQFKYKNF